MEELGLGSCRWGWWVTPILPTLRVLSTFHAVPRLRRQESSSSLQQYFQYDTLQQKLKCLEEENQKLRLEVRGDTWGAQWRSLRGGYGGLRAAACPKTPFGGAAGAAPHTHPLHPQPQATNIAIETCQYEDQEHQLMIDCVEQFCTWWGWWWVGGGAGHCCGGLW